VATFAQWVEGARPRTLPNAVAPVIAGTGVAAWLHAVVWWKAALVVAVGMIVGVNYANDYSDGIRGCQYR
jgi:1,4-dihydroxy-2-naphthoate polyprenyltransferase